MDIVRVGHARSLDTIAGVAAEGFGNPLCVQPSHVQPARRHCRHDGFPSSHFMCLVLQIDVSSSDKRLSL